MELSKSFLCLFAIISCCYGLVIERSDKSFIIPLDWGLVPEKASSPNVQQNTDHEKIAHVTTKAPVTTAKRSETPHLKSTPASEPANVGTKANRVQKTAPGETFFHSQNNIASVFSPYSSANSKNVPINTVILLINQNKATNQSFWNTMNNTNFPIHGSVQGCCYKNTKLKRHLEDSMAIKRRESGIKCDEILQSNLASLLSWARHAKKMATGAITATNFTIPSILGADMPLSAVTSNLQTRNNMEMPKIHSVRTARDAWHLIDFNKHINPETAHLSAAEKQGDNQKGIKVEEKEVKGIQDIFDVFSKIRIAFFRSFFESLGGINGPPASFEESNVSPRQVFPLSPSLVDLVTETIKDLKSVSKDQGYLFVISAPAEQLAGVNEVLLKETSSKDTLYVVTGICNTDCKPVPLFARGPKSDQLRNLTNICDVPTIIKEIMAVDTCTSPNCGTCRKT